MDSFLQKPGVFFRIQLNVRVHGNSHLCVVSWLRSSTMSCGQALFTCAPGPLLLVLACPMVYYQLTRMLVFLLASCPHRCECLPLHWVQREAVCGFHSSKKTNTSSAIELCVLITSKSPSKKSFWTKKKYLIDSLEIFAFIRPKALHTTVMH